MLVLKFRIFIKEANYLNSLYKNLFFWAIIIIVMVLLFNLFNKPRQTMAEKNYSDFISAVENNKVLEVEAKGRNIIWKDTENRRYKTYAPEDPEMIKWGKEADQPLSYLTVEEFDKSQGALLKFYMRYIDAIRAVLR